jgi:hypothetical protein
VTQQDRRRAKRHSLLADVKFLIGGRTEAFGKLIDISESGLALATAATAREGDEVIAYPSGLGRVSGYVSRVFEGGFAFVFDLSARQRQVLVQRMQAALSGATYMRLADRRDSLRIRYNLETIATLENEESFSCVIVDMSKTGCRLRCIARPDEGAMIRIGALKGVVSRQLEDGVAVKFDETLKSEQAA